MAEQWVVDLATKEAHLVLRPYTRYPNSYTCWYEQAGRPVTLNLAVIDNGYPLVGRVRLMAMMLRGEVERVYDGT